MKTTIIQKQSHLRLCGKHATKTLQMLLRHFSRVATRQRPWGSDHGSVAIEAVVMGQWAVSSGHGLEAMGKCAMGLA